MSRVSSYTGEAFASGMASVTQGSTSTVLGQRKQSGRVLLLTCISKGARLLVLHVDKSAAAKMIWLSGQWKQATWKYCLL